MNEVLNFEVSFVIPCLNEEKTLAQAIKLCQSAIEKLGSICEIVVADNGSTDNSIQIAETLGARVVNVCNKGYGNALIGGIKASLGKYVVMGDADATYNFNEAVEFIHSLRNNEADLVIGSRLKGDIEDGAMPFLHRYLGTPVLTFLIRNFFAIPISDCNCGMRAFTREAFDRLNMISGGMEFASEMLIKAGIIGIRVKEINCSLSKDTRGRAPHLKTWRDGWRHLKFILAFAPKHVFYYPGIFFIFLGILLTFIVLPGPIQITKEITLDYNFMYIGMALFIMGYQLIWLSKFERMFVQFVGYFKQESYPEFSFDNCAKFSGLIFSAGIVLAVISLIMWHNSTFIASKFNIRLLIISLDFMLLGFMTLVNSLMISMMSIKTHKLGS